MSDNGQCGTYWLHINELIWWLLHHPHPGPGPGPGDDILTRTYEDMFAHMFSIATSYNMLNQSAASGIRKTAYQHLAATVETLGKTLQLNPQPEPPAEKKRM